MAAERRESQLRYVRPLPEGTFETALLLVKETFPDETTGSSDASFWRPIEEKATTTPRRACFQYYLRGIGHEALAQSLLESFPQFTVAIRLGSIDKAEYVRRTSALANVILKYYPPRYRRKLE